MCFHICLVYASLDIAVLYFMFMHFPFGGGEGPIDCSTTALASDLRRTCRSARIYIYIYIILSSLSMYYIVSSYIILHYIISYYITLYHSMILTCRSARRARAQGAAARRGRAGSRFVILCECIYIYIYVYVYVYVYISLSLYIYIYIYTYLLFRFQISIFVLCVFHRVVRKLTAPKLTLTPTEVDFRSLPGARRSHLCSSSLVLRYLSCVARLLIPISFLDIIDHHIIIIIITIVGCYYYYIHSNI